MRRFFVFFLVFSLLFTCDGAGGEAVEPIVRLHIVADSDAEEAQRLKLKVRDSVLEAAQRLTAEADGAARALAILSANTGLLRACARDTARREGYDGPISVRIVREAFPAKRYGGVMLGAGEYVALRVEIGQARGQNWWCVIYPSLCYYGTPVEGGKICFYSSLRTWFSHWFGGGGDD